MGVAEIVRQIDLEIIQLQHARALLAGKTPAAVKAPKAAGAKKKSAKKKKRNLSPEGRKRIAEAARRRWAAQKTAAG